MRSKTTVLTLAAALLVCGLMNARTSQAQNLGYNSYEGHLSGGAGLNNYFGPGVGYGAPSGAFGDYHNAGDYFRRYVPPEQWGQFGYGTGHLGRGYGPYVFPRQDGASAPGMYDPPVGPYFGGPPPTVKLSRGDIYVKVPSNLPGIQRVTVTVLAYNDAELAVLTADCPPYEFRIPFMDGSKNVRVRIDYVDNGLSATSYPL